MATLGRLLILDDEPSAVEIVAFHLHQRDFEVTSSSDPREALEILRQGAHDLLVTDWMMPDLGGRELIELVKADPAIRHLPIVVITAKELDLEEREFLLNQDCVVLQKPFDPVALFEKVSEVIS